MAAFHGTKKDDDLTGTAGDDRFNLFKGGHDTVDAGGGDDLFKMGASLDAGDRLDGGDGRDVVFLHGDYSAGVVFDADTIKNVEVLRLGRGFDYTLTLADGNVAAGERLTINGAPIGSGHSLIFDGSAEADGQFTIYAGAGDDIITGGQKADKIFLTQGGSDTVHAGGGNDTIQMGGALNIGDRIDGGAGNDRLVLDGDYGDGFTTFFAFGGDTINSIETLILRGDHTYMLTMSDGNVAADARMTIDASETASGDIVIVDGQAETDGAFDFVSGVAGAQFIGGGGDDTFDLRLGEENFAFGLGGDDLFRFGDNFGAGTQVYGGSGSNTLRFEAGLNSLSLDQSFVTGIQTVAFLGGHDYAGVAISNDIANGATLTIDASGLGAADSISIGLGGATSAGYVFKGGGGDDTISFGGNFSASDRIAGGGGGDTLVLNGDYSGGLTFDAATITGIETLALLGAMKIVTDDGNVAAGDTLTVDASGDTSLVHFDASAETDGSIRFVAGTQIGVLKSGAGNDIFDLQAINSVYFRIEAGNGDDTINFGSHWNSNAIVTDSGGYDTATFDGAYGSTITVNTDFQLVGTDAFRFYGGHSYSLELGGSPQGSAILVDASALGAGDTFSVNLHTLGSGSLTTTVLGGAGVDTIIATSFEDTITGGLGADTITGGLGADTFVYTSAAQSSSTGHDTITDFNADADKFDLNVSVSGYDGLHTSNEDDTNLDSWINGTLTSLGGMGASHAIVLEGGAAHAFAHRDFLIIDANGDGQYSAGVDYVMEITGFTGVIDAGDFI